MNTPPDCLQAGKRKGQRTNWPGSKRARERIGQGPIGSGEQIGPGAKRLGTLLQHEIIFFVLLWEPPFCEAPVWSNMLNMAKSAFA